MPLALLVLAALPATAFAAPLATTTPEAATVSLGDQSLSVALDSGALTLTSPQGTRHFTISILHGDGWATPGPATAAPRITHDETLARVCVDFPVPGDRELGIELEAVAGVPVLWVTSRLRHLKDAGADYYFWSSDITARQYTAPATGGPREASLDTEKWDSLPDRDWLYSPGEAGGTLVLPTNVGGRAPGEAGSVFLHALPRSWLVAPGEPLEARFGLAAVASAREAQAAWETARDAGALARRWAEAALPEAPVDFGPPAPQWFRDVQLYNLYYRPSALWTDDIVTDRLSGFPLISGSTPDRAALDRCHRAGVRLLHYVTYTCLLDTVMQVAGGREVYSEWTESVDCESRDLKDHPGWVCVDKDGHIQKDAWGQSFNHPGLLNTCLHQPGLQEAALRQIRLLMETGYDGVFIDLAGPHPECYGPQFGKHTHPDPGKTNTQAWEDLQRRIYETVKSYGEDRIVIQNTCTGILSSRWAYCDAQMQEAWPHNAEGPGLRASARELQWLADRSAAAVAHGKRPVLLPYFGKGTTEELREGALSSLAYALLSGLPWADGFSLLDTPASAGFARELYAARPDSPIGPLHRSGEVWWRVYSGGVAALNTSDTPATVAVPWTDPAPLRDVARDRTLTAANGLLTLELAPHTGRVLTAP